MSALPAIQNHPTLQQTINARELHAFLEIGKDFSSWIKAQIKRAGLIENEDYVLLTQKGEQVSGAKTLIEYQLTIESGKHIAMMSQSSKGREVREYFLECEKIARQPQQPAAALTFEELAKRTISMANERIHALQEEKQNLVTQVEQIKPKADALDRIADTSGNICVTDAAKVLQIKPKYLFDWLSAHKWIYRRLGTGWLGFQCRLDQGVLQHKVVTIITGGQQKIREQVLITPKGLARLAEVFELEVPA